MRGARDGRHRRSSLVLVVSILLAVAGCSSGADGPDSAGPGSSTETGSTAAVGTVTLTATLTPEAVTPAPGPAGAAGTSELTFEPSTGEVCGRFELTGVEPLNIYVQQAPAGQRGPLVARLQLPADRTASPLEACGSVESDRGEVLVANPAQAYVQVDTRDAPAGALRGQLASAE